MKPVAKEFTRDNPCTKLDLWNCFMSRAGFVPVDVNLAQSLIGMNAPRVMERNGYLVREYTGKGDYYKLTPAGQDWLSRGFRNFLRNHPHRAKETKYLPGKPGGAERRVRRTRPA
jgi:hypothetical protein